jgi:hypothetical protein
MSKEEKKNGERKKICTSHARSCAGDDGYLAREIEGFGR